MELKGKKIVFLGDSITEGACASEQDKNFVSLTGRMCGADVVNLGVGGTRISRQERASACPAFDEDFLRRADKIGKDADVIVVFGGTNDYGHGDASLGSAGDKTPYTFYGACNLLFEKLKNDFPNAQKVVITPLRRANEDDPLGDHVREFATAPLPVYVAIVKAAAKAYGYPVLDLYNLFETDEELRETFRRSADGLHPDDFGHAVLAKKIVLFLQEL